ncbi:hypothetical protein C8034_v011623 [Colletotrichum sidae]|uniref:Uncharacterized protein n=1 Tax=Colletotrichum sidae TaxID=1347389 RepID=A0A4R8TID0_9PEZI|nr:hypothetical protein C8034_v011623 [Colletotrichum sidae]
MLLKFCLTTVFALRALAAPVEPLRDYDTEDWRLLNFTRVCAEDSSRCDYKFNIAEYANIPEKPAKACKFVINAADGRPAHEVGFSLATCPAASEYNVNGGWDPAGFVTLTVINNERSRISFFSYGDQELANGAEVALKQSHVYLHAVNPAKRAADGSEQDPKEGEWVIDNIMRYMVDEKTADEAWRVYGEGGSSSKSFFNQQCGENARDFSVSFGHNETTDEAVMTLVDTVQRKLAYFGFNDVSKTSLWNWRGPSPVSDLPLQLGPVVKTR